MVTWQNCCSSCRVSVSGWDSDCLPPHLYIFLMFYILILKPKLWFDFIDLQTFNVKIDWKLTNSLIFNNIYFINHGNAILKLIPMKPFNFLFLKNFIILWEHIFFKCSRKLSIFKLYEPPVMDFLPPFRWEQAFFKGACIHHSVHCVFLCQIIIKNHLKT